MATTVCIRSTFAKGLCCVSPQASLSQASKPGLCFARPVLGDSGFSRQGWGSSIGSGVCFHRQGPLGPERKYGRSLRVQSMSEESPLPSQMTIEDALKLFGVAENASFDEIIKVRRELVGRFEGDMEKLAEVDSAYDILLMKSFSRRKAGQVSEEGIRFADVRKARPANLTPPWLKSALNRAAVSFEAPSSKTLATEAALFGALAAWTFAGGLAQGSDLTPSASGGDIPGLQLAIALGAAFYFLQKERVKPGKAGLITVGGLAAGSFVGGLIEAWLRVDIVPILGIDSPAVVVSEFALVALFLVTAYVR